MTHDRTHHGETTARGLKGFAGREGRSDHSKDIGLELAPVVVEIAAVKPTGHTESRVGDNPIDAAELGYSFGYRSLQLSIRRHIALRHNGPPTLSANLQRKRLEPLPASGSEYQIGATTRKVPRHGRTNARRSPGNECNCSIESLCHCSTPFQSYQLLAFSS
jgi:hypothetical protein